jgi:hypothetical protein
VCVCLRFSRDFDCVGFSGSGRVSVQGGLLVGLDTIQMGLIKIMIDSLQNLWACFVIGPRWCHNLMPDNQDSLKFAALQRE